MAPRWLSRQSAWGPSLSEGPGRGLYIALAVAIFVVGSLAGYGVKSASGETTGNSQSVPASSAVIDPTVQGFFDADQTSNGAVKAATSFISGFASMSLQSTDSRRRLLASLCAPGTEALQTQLEAGLVKVHDDVTSIGLGNRQPASVIFAPGTYRVTMPAPDRARVEIWYAQVLLKGDGARFEETWQTATLDLVWTDHWRIADTKTVLGPTPQQFGKNGQPSPYSEIFDLLKNDRTNPPSQPLPYRNALSG